MLPFENRIKKKKDFEIIFKKGDIFHSETMVSIFLKNELKETRFGFIVSKKVSSKAVSRNRIKRVLREQTRLMLDKIKKGFDIVVIAKKEISEKDSKTIAAEIEELFTKKGIL